MFPKQTCMCCSTLRRMPSYCRSLVTKALPVRRDSNGHLNGALTNGHASDEGKGGGKAAGRARRREDEETAGLLAEQQTAGEASTSSWQEHEVRALSGGAARLLHRSSDRCSHRLRTPV